MCGIVSVVSLFSLLFSIKLFYLLFAMSMVFLIAGIVSEIEWFRGLSKEERKKELEEGVKQFISRGY